MFRIVILICVVGAGCGAGKAGDSLETDKKSSPAPLVVPEATQAGTVKIEGFTSAALGVKKSFYVYLPLGYETGTLRYPTIYMLHGLGGSEDNWTKYMKLTEAADAMHLQAIVIMPDGDDSFYVNSVTKADFDTCLNKESSFGGPSDRASYCVKSARHEDYIVKDLVDHIDATYRTKAKRISRAIGGLSMGGYGALMLGMRHPDIFSSVASHSGVAALLYEGPRPYAAGKTVLATDPTAFTSNMGRFGKLFLSLFGSDVDHWHQHDPAFLAQSLSDGDLAIYIDCGTEDEFHLQDGASYLHEVLSARGVHHRFELLPGHHDPSFWAGRIDKSLAFHVEQFQKAAAQAPAAD